MMAALRLAEHPLINALGWTLLHFVWQGALIGLGAYIILRAVRPSAASTRYLVGVAALALLLATPIVTFISLPNEPSETARVSSQTRTGASPSAALVTGSIIADVEANPAAARQLIPPATSPTPRPAPSAAPIWLPAVTAAWLAGVILLSLRLLGGWVLTRMLARRAVARVSPVIEAAAREIAVRLELQRGVAILVSAAVTVPTLIGWVRPVVLLPASVLSGLSPMQLQAILAHELAHVRRHDYLVNLLQSFVETVLFYHPAVWWVSSEVRTERENCCDDLAVAVCGDRLVYVSALAELTSIDRKALALAATDGSLLTRVRRILGSPVATRRELPPSWSILVLVALLGGGAGTYEITTSASAQATVDVSYGETRLQSESTVASSNRREVRTAQATAPIAPIAPIAPAPLAPDARTVPVAPLAPVAPVAPLAPVAPVAQSVHTSTQRGEGNFVWSDNGERIAVKWTGPFRLSDDERDIAWIEEGARVTVSDGSSSADRVELRGLEGGTVERTYYRGGSKREYDEEGRLFLANALARMIRSGMFASERVARFLKRGGPDAVLAEIDRLRTTSSYVSRVYYSALLKQADLSPALLTRVLDRVAKDVKSDYDKGVVFLAILEEPSVGDEQRVAVARAARSISSDYEQRKVLVAVLAHEPVSENVAAAAIDAVATIASNHDRGIVLGELARKGAVTPRSSTAFMAAVTSMSSAYEQRKVLAVLAGTPSLPESVAVDAVNASQAINSSHDRRQALSAYMERRDSSPELAAAALASAGKIDSSHDKAEVLLQLVRKGDLTDQTATALFTAATTITSSHDLSRVLREVAARPNLSDTLLAGLLKAARSVNSSHDRAMLLLDVLKMQPLSAATRQLFLDTAQGISSSHDQNRVLAELVRTERR